MDLTQRKCVACEGGVPPLTHDEVQKYLGELTTKWTVEENKRIRREFEFKDFKQAMEFVNKVAELAESEGHHPDIAIHYNKIAIELWTHAIGGLSENDFIVARKIELL